MVFFQAVQQSIRRCVTVLGVKSLKSNTACFRRHAFVIPPQSEILRWQHPHLKHDHRRENIPFGPYYHKTEKCPTERLKNVSSATSGNSSDTELHRIFEA